MWSRYPRIGSAASSSGASHRAAASLAEHRRYLEALGPAPVADQVPAVIATATAPKPGFPAARRRPRALPLRLSAVTAITSKAGVEARLRENVAEITFTGGDRPGRGWS